MSNRKQRSLNEHILAAVKDKSRYRQNSVDRVVYAVEQLCFEREEITLAIDTLHHKGKITVESGMVCI